MTANWNQPKENHELAYFRADVCFGPPQSFSLEEKKQICARMAASTAEFLHVSKRIVTRPCANGNSPSFKAGDVMRISKPAFAEHMAGRA